MKIFGILAASLLCAAAPGAPHATVAAARPAATSAAAKPAATNQSKPAVVKPVPARTPAARPAQRPAVLRADVVHGRPIVRRWTPYWETFCLTNPYAAICQEHEFAVRQTAAAPEAPSVNLNPFATTTQPSAPASMLAYQTVSSAPAKPIVKVSDELAAGVSVGAGQANILEKLGEPHSRISGDVERYTYFLQSGGSLKLDFADGRVTQVWKASN